MTRSKGNIKAECVKFCGREPVLPWDNRCDHMGLKDQLWQLREQHHWGKVFWQVLLQNQQTEDMLQPTLGTYECHSCATGSSGMEASWPKGSWKEAEARNHVAVLESLKRNQKMTLLKVKVHAMESFRYCRCRDYVLTNKSGHRYGWNGAILCLAVCFR